MDFIEDNINVLYENVNNRIIDSKYINELSDDEINELGNFHMTSLTAICKEDDYFCGIRANHFCIECGYSEIHNNKNIILISANHKGFRKITMLSAS